MREMVRYANVDKNKATYVNYLIYQLKNVPKENTVNDNSDNEELKQLCYLYECSKVCSIEIINHINNYQDLLTLSKEHIDDLSNILYLLVQQPRYDLLVVHDCFTCLPKYMNYVRYNYNMIMSNIVKSNLLNFLLFQITPQHTQYNVNQELKDYLSKLVLNSNYGIC